MAFQDFDHISERRRNERRQKLKKRITIAVVSIVVVLLIAAAVCTVMYKSGGNDSKASRNSSGSGGNAAAGGAKEVSHSQRAIKMICAPTDYKKACESSLAKEVGSNSSAPRPKLLVKAAIAVASDELKKAKNKASSLKFDSPQQRGAYEDCLVLLEDATEELNSSISEVDKQNLGKLSSITPDLENWLSAVMSYQETCIDGFPEGDELKPKMERAMKTSKELASNALAIISQVSSVFSSRRRRLLDDGGVPAWMSHEDRRVLKGKDQKKLTPDAIVAKDGSGNFTTINAALAAIPENRQHRYIIYVKEGIYDESVTITKKMTNITMYGDGSQKSVVTGSKNFVDGVRTFQTATFVAIGEGFTAQSMGFRNTAGPEKHQAVALRVQSDRSIFLNCRMEGYQDTLYVQTHRQFYRGCLIAGTIDFIFGDAAAVLQNCLIKVRKPLDGQQNTVTAQGRLDRRQTTGIVLQNCRILADESFEAEKRGAIKSYLGRPWKEFSKTVVMESEISDVIHPDGWLAWNGDFALKTLYYAEYNNKGAGSNVRSRVKWPGYKVINKEEAAKFTVGPFLQGDSWLKSRAVPVHFGLY